MTRRTLYAAVVVVLAFAWQYLTVEVNYGGNWTALFCTGSTREVPPQLADEPVYVFPDSDGFDGQFYHYIAHSPWPEGGLEQYVEAPAFRYRRILVPAMAYFLAFGQQGAIHFTYLATGLLFLFLGTWWTARYAESVGASSCWGFAFPALAASLVYIDRLTVDIALAALTAAFALYAARGPSWKLYAILLLAPLARETGLVLTAAYCGCCVLERKWKLTAVFATSAAPWLGWHLYLTQHFTSDRYPTNPVPLAEIVHSLLNPVEYPSWVPLRGLVQAGDVLALAGILSAIVLAGVLAARRRTDPTAWAAALFALAAIVIQRSDVWETVFNHGRLFTPLVALVLLGFLPGKPVWAALPAALMLPRLLMQFGRQFQGIVDALFSGFST